MCSKVFRLLLDTTTSGRSMSLGTSVALAQDTNMLRISHAARANDTEPDLLRVEGQVTGRWVEELRRVCAETIGSNGHSKSGLVLDLAGVSFLDADGIALFGELAARRVLFTNCSAFIAEQLKGVADVDR